MTATYELISTVTVSTATAASIEFTSIPATFDDLIVLTSTRSNAPSGQAVAERFRFNGNSATNYTYRVLEAFSGTATQSYTGTSQTFGQIGAAPTDATTANTFGNASFYIPNYRSNTNKSTSSDTVAEYNSASLGVLNINANVWTVTDAITSISIFFSSGDLKQYSSASLYGIKKS